MSVTQAISVEEFWEKYANSETGRYEYDHGQLIRLPMPDWLHGLIVQRICYLMSLLLDVAALPGFLKRSKPAKSPSLAQIFFPCSMICLGEPRLTYSRLIKRPHKIRKNHDSR
jgi:Uma2 family endonuclease